MLGSLKRRPGSEGSSPLGWSLGCRMEERDRGRDDSRSVPPRHKGGGIPPLPPECHLIKQNILLDTYMKFKR